MRWPKKFTLVRIATHDFNRSLRVWQRYIPKVEIFKCLTQERAKALAFALRTFAVAVLGTLWLSANKSSLVLKISYFDVSVPAAFVNFWVALLVLGTAINVINYFVLNEFVRVATNRLFKFDSSWAHTTIMEGGSAWSLGWVNQFRFISSSQIHRRLGTIVSWFSIFPFLAILIVVYWTIFAVGYDVIGHDGIFSLGCVFTIIAWLLISFPFAYLVLIRTPFTFDKNVRFARWNFLAPMHKRFGPYPAHVFDWLPPRSDNPLTPPK